jgi:hypothetical protein
MFGAHHEETQIQLEEIPAEVIANFKGAHPDSELDNARRVSVGQSGAIYYRLFFHLRKNEADYWPNGHPFPAATTEISD